MRYLLTSGSTGLPKVVAQTNLMWCWLFDGASYLLGEASGWRVRTLDWMPWSHVAGASVLLGTMFNGGAGLPQPVYDFQRMAEETIGERVMFTTGYGCTEATAGIVSIYWPTTEVGVGLPVPGLEVKLVPLDGERYEARFRGRPARRGVQARRRKLRPRWTDQGRAAGADQPGRARRADPRCGIR